MSPVSRGRKTKGKKKKNRTPGRSRTEMDTALRRVAEVMGEPRRGVTPLWFAPAIGAVLESDAVLGATGPAALEQVVCELLGGQMHARLSVRGGEGLWFDWFAEAVASAAADRVVDAEDDLVGGSWKAPWRLLHGLLAIGTPELCAHVADEVERCAPVLGPLGEVPHWLASMTSIRATGEGWSLRDEYGTRQALIAAYSYPGGTDPTVFLFDLDVSTRAAELIAPGAYTDLDTAVAAWRSAVGDAAGPAEPEQTTDFELLAQVVTGQYGIMGNETRETMDNWFRAPRRIAELARLLAIRGTPLPEPEHLFGDIDVAPMVAEFTAWHRERHGTEPDQETASDLAIEWTEGVLPETWYRTSPERVTDRRALIGDWIPDHPVTAGAIALLPEWSRWLGERSGLRPELVERAVAASRLP